MNNHLGSKIISITILALLGLLLILGSPQVRNIASASIPTVVDPKDLSIMRDIDKYEKLLKEGKLGPEDRKNIEEKLKNAEKEATKEAMLTNNQDKAYSAKLTGIVEITQSLSKPKEKVEEPSRLVTGPGIPQIKDALFGTAWIDNSGVEPVIYLAGHLVDTPEQGVIFICRDKCIGEDVERFYTSEKDGSLEVLRNENGKLVLSSKKGKEFRFNMNQKRFENKSGVPLPILTITPSFPAYP